MVLVVMVMRMEVVTQRFGINISAKKSGVMYVDRGSVNVRMEDVNLRRETIRKLSEFTYLGSVVTSDGKTREDIEKRRPGARTTFGSLRRDL